MKMTSIPPQSDREKLKTDFLKRFKGQVNSDMRERVVKMIEWMKNSNKLRENSLISPLESHRIDDQEYGWNSTLTALTDKLK